MLSLTILSTFVYAGTSPTFYFSNGFTYPGCPEVQTFNDGNRYGPCPGPDGQSGNYYTEASKYWVAIYGGKNIE